MAIAIGEWSQIIAMSSFLDIKKKEDDADERLPSDAGALPCLK
jgi:hypothetical protein